MLGSYDYECQACGLKLNKVLDTELRDTVRCPLRWRHLLRFKSPFGYMTRLLSAPRISVWRSNQTSEDKRWRKDLGEASKLKETFARRYRKLDAKQRSEIKRDYRRLKGEDMQL